MRYYTLGSDAFVENGRSVLRVGHVITMVSPVSVGRTIKVFEVLEEARKSPTNPSPPRGALIALSFPDEKVNGRAYQWARNEESQVPLEITPPDPRKDSLNSPS